MNKRPRLIKDYLNRTNKLHGLIQQSMEQSLLLKRIRTLIPAPLDAHCTAAVSKDTGLVLYVDSSTWASRLRFMSRELVQRLNSDGMNIKRITVRVLVTSQPPERKHAPIRHLSEENAFLISQTAADIDDHDLSEALLRLGKHATRATE